MITRITFVRHGENVQHADGIFASTDPADTLTNTGREQARRTADYLEETSVDAVFASPLPRARQTATVIGEQLGLEPQIVEGLEEVDVGVISGARADQRTWDEWNRVVDAWAEGRVTVQFPGGENYTQLWNRFRAAIEHIVEGREGQHRVIVAHGGILRATLHDLCPGSNVKWYRNFPIENGAVIEVEVGWQANRVMSRRLQGRVIEWASTDHLNGAGG